MCQVWNESSVSNNTVYRIDLYPSYLALLSHFHIKLHRVLPLTFFEIFILVIFDDFAINVASSTVFFFSGEMCSLIKRFVRWCTSSIY